jgi:hypothetical protein
MKPWTCDAAYGHRLANEYLEGVPIQGPPYITRKRFIAAFRRAGKTEAQIDEVMGIMDRNLWGAEGPQVDDPRD